MALRGTAAGDTIGGKPNTLWRNDGALIFVVMNIAYVEHSVLSREAFTTPVSMSIRLWPPLSEAEMELNARSR